MRVILALGQSGISKFALVGKKIKEKMPSVSTNQHSSDFALYVIRRENNHLGAIKHPFVCLFSNNYPNYHITKPPVKS